MPRLTRHPEEAALLALEMGRNEPDSAAAALHVAGCRTCTRRGKALGVFTPPSRRPHPSS